MSSCVTNQASWPDIHQACSLFHKTIENQSFINRSKMWVVSYIIACSFCRRRVHFERDIRSVRNPRSEYYLSPRWHPSPSRYSSVMFKFIIDVNVELGSTILHLWEVPGHLWLLWWNEVWYQLLYVVLVTTVTHITLLLRVTDGEQSDSKKSESGKSLHYDNVETMLPSMYVWTVVVLLMLFRTCQWHYKILELRLPHYFYSQGYSSMLT